MPQMPEQWDFFIIHSSRDLALARQLHDELDADFDVFLDSESITLGAPWDEQPGRTSGMPAWKPD